MLRIARYISILSDIINAFISRFVVLLIFILSFLLGVAVFYRYTLNDSIYWSNEVARYILVYIVFFGSTMAYKHKNHIRIDMIFAYISKKNQERLDVMIAVLFILFWVLILVGSLKLLPFFMMQKTATLHLPFALPFAAIPLSALVWVLYSIDDICKEVLKR